MDYFYDGWKSEPLITAIYQAYTKDGFCVIKSWVNLGELSIQVYSLKQSSNVGSMLKRRQTIYSYSVHVKRSILIWSLYEHTNPITLFRFTQQTVSHVNVATVNGVYFECLVCPTVG